MIKHGSPTEANTTHKADTHRILEQLEAAAGICMKGICSAYACAATDSSVPLQGHMRHVLLKRQ
jgi:S-adenosylmethionine synthetase